MKTKLFYNKFIKGWLYSLIMTVVAIMLIIFGYIISSILNDLPIFPISLSEVITFFLGVPAIMFVFLTPYYSYEIEKKGSGIYWLITTLILVGFYVFFLSIRY